MNTIDSFNKSHACVYADIAYKTAWLKYYYPLEYMCALMIHKHDEADVIAERVMQCKNLDIVILPPDINKSSERLTIDSGAIRFALGSIDGVGDEALINIKELQPFTSLEDFIERADTRKCGQKVVVNLIKAGAFDFTNIDRLTLIRTYFTLKSKKKELVKYEDMEYNEHIKMTMEREVIGFYLSVSPLDKYNFKPLESYIDQKQAIVGGEVTKIKEIKDKKNRSMAFLTITTQYNNVEVIVFADTFKQYNDIIKEGELVIVNGKRDGAKLLANEFTRISGG